MTDQPLIIEESIYNQPKKAQQYLDRQEQSFFSILDAVETYDVQSHSIRQLHQEAMLSLANLKFTNTNTLTINSHRCLPAFLTLNQQNHLQAGYILFKNTINQDKYFDEFDEQKEIEQECLQKQESKQQNSQESGYRQHELLYRFNIMNEPGKVLSVASKFQKLLQELLLLAQRKQQVLKYLSSQEKVQTK